MWFESPLYKESVQFRMRGQVLEVPVLEVPAAGVLPFRCVAESDQPNAQFQGRAFRRVPWKLLILIQASSLATAAR
jgi:hypothetical protein